MGTLRVNETKITAENTLNTDHIWMEGNHESKNEDNQWALLWKVEGLLIPNA